MQNLTSRGNILGSLPVTVGRTFWVSPAATYTVNGVTYNASDGNDGLDPKRALRTINQAWTKVTANVGDVIVLMPGTHTPQNATGTATSVAASVAGVTMMGLPFSGVIRPDGKLPAQGLHRRTIISASLADELVNVTAADIEIAFLHFSLTTAADPSQQAIDASAAANRLHIHDCTFDMTITTDDTALMCIELLGTANQVVIDHCHFYVENNAGPAIRVSAAATNLNVQNSTVEWGRSATAWDDVFEVTTTALGLVFKDLDIISNNTTDIVDVFEIAGATGDEATSIWRCYCPAGADFVEPANAADFTLIQGWTAQVGGNSGGTAVTG